jgi:hypothetical protein
MNRLYGILINSKKINPMFWSVFWSIWSAGADGSWEARGWEAGKPETAGLEAGLASKRPSFLAYRLGPKGTFVQGVQCMNDLGHRPKYSQCHLCHFLINGWWNRLIMGL